MWSRVKRAGRGAKIDASTWTKGQLSRDEGEVSDSAEASIGRAMEEAVERGYASDSEDKEKKLK